MKLEVLKEKSKKLLSSKEILLKLDFDQVTPKEEDVKKEIATHLKLNPEILKVYRIKQGFGQRSAKVLAYVYENKDSMAKVEIRKKKVKKEVKKEEKKE